MSLSFLNFFSSLRHLLGHSIEFKASCQAPSRRSGRMSRKSKPSTRRLPDEEECSSPGRSIHDSASEVFDSAFPPLGKLHIIDDDHDLIAPTQRAVSTSTRPLAPYSTITVKILTSDKLPAADTCKLIKDTLNGLKKRKILLSKVKSVRITRDPMVELYLRSETEQKALKASIQTLARLASPTHIELNSLDNFRHPSRSGLVFNILDDLVELWLDKGVERITSRGQFHRLRHGYYENPSSPNLILDLQRHLVSYLST